MQASHLPYLDGVRGIAALWVLLFHTQLLCGMPNVPLLSYGKLAVDLFMVMSGFLMAHHYLLRQEKEPFQKPKTWFVFWIRRYFRIAPLYYALLGLAFVIGPFLGEYRELLGNTWPQAQTESERYLDRSIGNVVSHLVFVFGAIPEYHFNTPLPDWSIGLEMQFYAVFPFIMMLVGYLGPVVAISFVAALCAASYLALQEFYAQFSLPSLLPMKFYMFGCGILLAISRINGRMREYAVFSSGLVMIEFLLKPSAESISRVAMVIALFYLMNDGTLPGSKLLNGAIQKFRGWLGSRLGHFLGEMSYSVYLVHLLIIIPMVAKLTQWDVFLSASGPLRFIICLLVCTPLIYLTSFIVHHVIERPFIKVGKKAAGLLESPA
jgi:peptidoglycan/LPS O-acetylase OafA/YrhL